MPPWSSWWRGRDTIAEFAKEAMEFCPASLALPVSANGQVGVAYFQLDSETGRYVATAIDVITFDGELIAAITAFVRPDIFARFGLPEELACAVRH
jgi:RNA polymerase sigma-70 factor (ECF subfamily)